MAEFNEYFEFETNIVSLKEFKESIKGSDYVLVKREDLDWLLKMANYELNKKDKKRLEKIRESLK